MLIGGSSTSIAAYVIIIYVKLLNMQNDKVDLGTMSARLHSFFSTYQSLGERQHSYDGITLSLAEVRMLDCVAANPGGSLSRLSQDLKQSRSASFQMVGRLSSYGLVRKQDARSGHSVAVSLTERGVRVHQERKDRLARLSQSLGSVLERYPPEFLKSVSELMTDLENTWNSNAWLDAGTGDAQ